MAAIINLLYYAYTIYSGLLCVYALLSWLPGAYNSKLGEVLYNICEPYLSLFRRLPLQFGGIDFSIIVGLFALRIGYTVIIQLIVRLMF